jgi:glycosyltransferase involved in cell wall biosynthesis
MKVTGFSFIRNAVKYDYPIRESILSILPVVDEYVIAVGNSDDTTRELVKSIASDKIRIIDTVWNESIRTGGAVLADETNKAFQAIAQDSDWAFYLQGDECIHEKDYPAIRSAMQLYKDSKEVDGLLFKYIHFFGTYNYVGTGRRWYRKEIRVIRNNKNIISWRDAQGFRFNDQTKLKVKEIDAHIYHYGWVKHPVTSNNKALFFRTLHDVNYKITPEEMQKEFDYHHIDRLAIFKGTHPAVMADRLKSVNWEFEFDPKQKGYSRMLLKHKLGHFIEDLTGIRVGEYKNYIKI